MTSKGKEGTVQQALCATVCLRLSHFAGVAGVIAAGQHSTAYPRSTSEIGAVGVAALVEHEVDSVPTNILFPMGDHASNPFISSTDQVGPITPMSYVDAACIGCWASPVAIPACALVCPFSCQSWPTGCCLALAEFSLGFATEAPATRHPLTPCCDWQLFQAEVAPVPPHNQNQHLLSPVASVGYSSPSSSAPPAGGPSSSGHGGQKPLNTLDEPVWDTILRDLKRIGANVVLVVFPFTNRDQQSAALRNWDLWGPMVCSPWLSFMWLPLELV